MMRATNGFRVSFWETKQRDAGRVRWRVSAAGTPGVGTELRSLIDRRRAERTAARRAAVARRVAARRGASRRVKAVRIACVPGSGELAASP